MSVTDINVHPIHLGRNASAEIEPEFTGDPRWYESYVARHAEDGIDGRLVSMYRFTGNWDAWEVHPKGSEVVLCVGGSMTLHQEKADGSRATVTLTAGQYAINEPGTWHTADIDEEATAVFITSGIGTDHRPRE
jgi:quercetin dioxygenase-like cupin family protein